MPAPIPVTVPTAAVAPAVPVGTVIVTELTTAFEPVVKV